MIENLINMRRAASIVRRSVNVAASKSSATSTLATRPLASLIAVRPLLLFANIVNTTPTTSTTINSQFRGASADRTFRWASTAATTTTATGGLGSSDNLATNPLMSNFDHPNFPAITAAHVEPAVSSVLNTSNTLFGTIEAQLSDTHHPNWSQLIEPLERLTDHASTQWEIVRCLIQFYFT
jgi:hypothetical protein